jgi:hypothetical protein
MDDLIGELASMLADDDARLAALFPGDRPDRQPVHTCYVPADRATSGTCRAWGEQALALLDTHVQHPSGQHAAALAAILPAETGIGVDEVEAVLPRVRAKLAAQPVEDLRIDFEDGYGTPGDLEEDGAALAAGRAIAELAGQQDGPLMAGVRIKSLHAPTRARAVRTLDLVLGAAILRGGLPRRFVVTFPKVASVAQVHAAVHAVESLEGRHGLARGAVRLELQIEVPQAIIGPDGTAGVAALVHAASGRCEGVHYGTYDFSAALGVSASQQASDHPLADHAKQVMQIATAGTGVRVSDGSTNVLPVGTTHTVSAAWATHARLVDRALKRALWQGWDLHPGQLVTRYLVTYAFLRRELAASASRLRAYVERTSGTASAVLDEPATAQALATAVLRGLDCGAVDEDEVLAATGLERDRLLALANRTPDQPDRQGG